MTAGNASQWQENIADIATGIDTLASQGGTAGVQYTDGAAAPTHPIGNQIMFNNAGTETAVSAANPLPVSATVTPAANQRVNAQANDFLTGSIVDLLTLLTLAGTPTDANTVNSLMGRLTKIRDLLNATLTVSASGNFNSASVGTDGSAIPGSSTLIGASDGANLQQLLVESASNRNLRTAIYNGANELSVNSAGQAQVEDIEQSGYIALSSPPSTTNAGSDTPLTFSSQVNRVIIQNNTSANVNYAFDTSASAGSMLLVPGATLIYPKKCTVLHLFTAAAQNINGSTAGNIVALGAM